MPEAHWLDDYINSAKDELTPYAATAAGMVGKELSSLIGRPDAVFKGYQTPPGEVSTALFDVIKEGHPLQGSTVSAKTLAKHGLQIPEGFEPATGGEMFTDFKGPASLSSANTFPEKKFGDAIDYMKKMYQNGASSDEVEEFMRQYQHGNTMPGVRPDLFAGEAKKGIELKDLIEAGKGIVPKGISMGTVIPPWLDEIAQKGMLEQGGAM